MICVCVAVDLVGGGGSPPPVHDYACGHLQADCLESGISYAFYLLPFTSLVNQSDQVPPRRMQKIVHSSYNFTGQSVRAVTDEAAEVRSSLHDEGT